MTLVHAWHAVCWAAVQALPPQRGATWAGRVAQYLRTWSSAEAIRISQTLRGGTCLSRALAVASRMENARVAIGAQPHATRSRFLAHAWVDVDGRPLIASEATGPVFAYLSVRRSGNGQRVSVCFDKGGLRCEMPAV